MLVIAKKPPKTIVQQLKVDFAVVADYFGMPEKDRKVALDSAIASLSRSAACYRAIAKSLVGISANNPILPHYGLAGGELVPDAVTASGEAEKKFSSDS